MTAPAAGWATSDLSDGFKRPVYEPSRVATRSVPGTMASAAPTSSVVAAKSSTNVGAIAGGTVGGVVVLVGIIGLAIFCLRSRRRKRAAQTGGSTQPNTADNARSPTVEEKSVTHFSTSQGSTMYSPNSNVSAYSPHGSPRPPTDHHNSAAFESPVPHQYSGSDYSQQGGLGFVPQHGYQQTYFPPPQDPSHSPHINSAELPGGESAAYVAELPNVRSPKPVRGLY